jgi:hypothetical protein
MDSLENLIESVRDGKGRYGLCDACVHRQGDYCLFHNLRRRSEGGKTVVTAKKLGRVEKCDFFNFLGWVIPDKNDIYGI